MLFFHLLFSVSNIFYKKLCLIRIVLLILHCHFSLYLSTDKRLIWLYPAVFWDLFWVHGLHFKRAQVQNHSFNWLWHSRCIWIWLQLQQWQIHQISSEDSPCLRQGKIEFVFSFLLSSSQTHLCMLFWKKYQIKIPAQSPWILSPDQQLREGQSRTGVGPVHAEVRWFDASPRVPATPALLATVLCLWGTQTDIQRLRHPLHHRSCPRRRLWAHYYSEQGETREDR